MGSLPELEAWHTPIFILVVMRVSTSASLSLSVSGGGCWYYAKQQNGTMRIERRNEQAQL